MQKDKDIPGISCGLMHDNIFEWEIMLMLDEEQDSLYGGECSLSSGWLYGQRDYTRY